MKSQAKRSRGKAMRRKLAWVCVLSMIAWLQSQFCAEGVHYLSGAGTLFGAALVNGRMVFTMQSGVTRTEWRRHLALPFRFYLGRWLGGGADDDASNYNLWGPPPYAQAAAGEPSEHLKCDRITSRWNYGALAWERGGKVDSGIPVYGEMYDPRKPLPAPAVAPGQLPHAPFAKPGEQLIDRWLFLTLPIWLITLSTSPALLLCIRDALLRIRSRQRIGRGCCASCGYNLHCLTTARCPECGMAAEAADHSVSQDAHRE